MTIRHFNLSLVDDSWRECLQEALTKVDNQYLEKLYRSNDWLPGHNNIFNAFSLPVDKVKTVLFGESPYPRMQSANGYAFWDAAVKELWSNTGLSKPVNRATSLRNMIKMLLVAEGLLHPDNTGQDEINIIDKTPLVKTNNAFFSNLLHHGFLLMNVSLVLQTNDIKSNVKKDALAWIPFIKHVIHFLLQNNPQIQLLLFGKIAIMVDQILAQPMAHKLYAEHPYNLSFINNLEVLNFFRPLHLLRANENEII